MITREHQNRKCILVDDLAPEDVAMVQALYSRSPESAEAHLEKVKRVGSGKFMGTYYVGYNHKSIADCGTTTMFIEGVSMLAAKAIQDWPLYSGQETSTRYIDMSTRRMADPVGTPRSKEIQEAWMDFYRSSLAPVEENVRARYPRRPEIDKEADYDRAVKARVFDILRAFIPAGMTTQLSWHTNLRQAGDHLNLLVKHPAKEIRDVAQELLGMFVEQYTASASFDQAGVSGVTGGAGERATWEITIAETYTYPPIEPQEDFRTTLHGQLDDYETLLRTRPRGAVLPHFLSDLGQLQWSFFLDFGSFRDIQRHRNGVCRMPLLTLEHGFEPWYLDELGESLRLQAVKLIDVMTAPIYAITADPIARQYYIPMGFRCPCRVTYGLPAAVYVLELRSSKTVHPTLRRVVQKMIRSFRSDFPYVTLHTDNEVDDWTVRRGQQTIEARP